jgi:hypothetical protein
VRSEFILCPHFAHPQNGDAVYRGLLIRKISRSSLRVGDVFRQTGSFRGQPVLLALRAEGACPGGTVLALSHSAVTFPKQDAHTSFAVPYAKA